MHMSSADQVLSSLGTHDSHEPQGGERCPTCHRRQPKPKRDTSPSEVARFQALGPRDRIESIREGYDNLMEYCEADPESYPMLVLLELGLSALAGQREELRQHFRGRVEL